MLNFGASKPRVRGGPGPRAPPGSAPGLLRNFLTSNSTKLKYFDKHLFLQIGLGKSNERKKKKSM